MRNKRIETQGKYVHTQSNQSFYSTNQTEDEDTHSVCTVILSRQSNQGCVAEVVQYKAQKEWACAIRLSDTKALIAQARQKTDEQRVVAISRNQARTSVALVTKIRWHGQ